MTRGSKPRYQDLAQGDIENMSAWLESHVCLVTAVLRDSAARQEDVDVLAGHIQRGRNIVRAAAINVECANLEDYINDGNKRRNGPSPRHLKRARELGMRVVLIEPDPTPLFPAKPDEAA